MKIVAIISEYNPFHTGHMYQIRKIRELFGEDTAIISVMSGNYVQRGDVAIADKIVRAECAVRGGANLVLEIPFPFSMSSAEFFAESGVKIANSLGIVDYLSFGSECGDVLNLCKISKNMMTQEFKSKLREALSSDGGRALGYATICESVYKSMYQLNDKFDFSSPNNILALEYIKALHKLKSDIKPHTIMRCGAEYSEENICNTEHQSASAIRKLMLDDLNSAINYVPKESSSALLSACFSGQAPCDAERISAAIISKLRLNPEPQVAGIHDAVGGLYNRLYNASYEANSITSLISSVETKKYTTARIRRAIWYSFFGVTSSNVKELPLYTQLLASDAIGRKILKEVKKRTDFPILTKPSSFERLSEAAKAQKGLADSADAIFQLTKPLPPSGGYALMTGPYISK